MILITSGIPKVAACMRKKTTNWCLPISMNLFRAKCVPGDDYISVIRLLPAVVEGRKPKRSYAVGTGGVYLGITRNRRLQV